MEDCNEHLKFEIEELTPALQKEAEVQLNETEEIKTKALEELRYLIKNETKLVTPVNDEYFLQYLRTKKFNVKNSFKLIQNYWKFRAKHKKLIFDTLNPTEVKDFLYENIIGVLPYRDKQGCTLIVFKIGQWNTDIFPAVLMMQTIIALLLFTIRFPATQICGYRVIFDFRGFSWQQMKICTPANIMLLISGTQFCFPGRFKGVHVISDSKFFTAIWAIAYPILTAKLKQRIQIHGDDLSPLQNYIHPSVLPSDYGGCADNLDNNKWKKLLDDNTNILMDQLNYGYKK